MHSIDELVNIATQAEDSGDLEHAIRVWQTIAELKPTAKAFARLGQLEEDAGQWQRAQDAFEMASTVQPNWQFPFTCLAILALSRTDISKDLALAQAKSYLDESIAREQTPAAWSILGSVERELGAESEARLSFERALELDPAYIEAAFNLAELKEEHDPTDAKLLLERVLAIDPDYVGAHQAYGKLLQKEGKLAEAIQQFEESIKLNSKDYWSHLYLANALAVCGDLSKADIAFRQALEIDPTNKVGQRFFADFLQAGSMNGEATTVWGGDRQ